MRKYLYLLFVAMFATMSFTLASCGDDNDNEPEDNGSGTGTETTTDFTINGVKYDFNFFYSQFGQFDGKNTFYCSADDEGDENGIVIYLYNWDELTQGYVYSTYGSDIEICFYSQDKEAYPEDHYFFTTRSGKVEVTYLNKADNVISLSFKNVKFYAGSDFSVTINGTLTMPIEGYGY